jgi:hypothetical protein
MLKEPISFPNDFVNQTLVRLKMQFDLDAKPYGGMTFRLTAKFHSPTDIVVRLQCLKLKQERIVKVTDWQKVGLMVTAAFLDIMQPETGLTISPVTRSVKRWQMV